MKQRIPVVQVGLGPIGNRVTRYLLENGAFEIVGALDQDAGKRGQDVAELAGLPAVSTTITDDPAILSSCGAKVAVITTVSGLAAVSDQIQAAVEAGLHVVSTCEELAYPWHTQHELASRIDKLAKAHQVSVLGTGINPGFLMDYLVVAMTAVCLNVESVLVERVQDAANRRLPFQKKIGAGLSPEAFAERVESGTLRHVGLTESMHMIAARLGLELERTEDVVEPVMALAPAESPFVHVAAGQALGIMQTGRGFCEGREVITLKFRAALGESHSYDRVHLEATPPVDIRIEGGINGDIGTGAITVNSIATLLAAPAGLRTMADISPVACFNSRRRAWD